MWDDIGFLEECNSSGRLVAWLCNAPLLICCAVDSQFACIFLLLFVLALEFKSVCSHGQLCRTVISSK